MAEINDRSEESPVKVKEIEDRFKKKLTLALSKLLEESLSISDDTILEKLFTHLVTKIKSDGNMRKTLTVYVLWLCLVMKRWTTLQSSVQVFAIRLAGVVASTPVGFFMLEEQLVIAMLTERVFIQETQCDSSLMLGVVNFITEAVKHQVGCNWVIQTEIWRRAVQLCHTDTSLYTTKASAKFITHLVLLFERTDKDACHLVIDAILRPLSIAKTKEPLPSRMEILKSLQFYVSPDGVPTVYSHFLPKDNSNERTPADSAICRMTPISTKVPHRTLLASIRFLNEVLYSLLKSQMSVQRVNDIFIDYSLEMWAWEQVHVENDDVELLRSLSTMLTLLNFLGTEHTINGDIAYCDIELLSIATLRLIEILIYKRQYTLVFDICVHCHKLRGHVVKNVIYKNTEIEKPSFDLGNQLIIVQVLWMCLHDECDLQVVRAAVRVIHKLMDLLLLHSNNNNTENTSPQTLVFDTFGVDNNFTCKEIKDYFSDDSIEDEDEAMPCETTQNVEMSTDNAIDQIVEHDDIDLLSTVYKLNSNWEPTSSTKTQEKFITAKEFLKKIGEIDIDEMVNCRLTWLENSSDNLESLLDDVLAVNNDLPEHINNVGLDCY